MVIEPDDADRAAIERLVSSLPFLAWQGAYRDPNDALNDMKRHAPDVVITALALPGMNGLHFTSALSDSYPDICSIVAADNGHHAKEAYDAGARGYLIKPIAREALFRLFADIRAKHRPAREGGKP